MNEQPASPTSAPSASPASGPAAATTPAAGPKPLPRGRSPGRPPPPPVVTWTHALLTIGFALATVVGFSVLVGVVTTNEVATLDATVTRAPNVHVLPKRPESLPPPPSSGRQLLLMGNSHTFALPGLNKGDTLRPDPGVTLIDELAAGISQANPGAAQANYLRLALPNFLPVEMLAHYLHVLQRGYHPDVLVIGLTWRNVARDSGLRRELDAMFSEPEFLAFARAQWADPQLQVPAAYRELFDAKVRQVSATEAATQELSHADAFDKKLTQHVADFWPLLGRSTEIRQLVYRSVNFWISERLVADEKGFNYEVVEPDLALNVAAFETLLRVATARGAKVLVYRAPERDDLAPLMNPARESEVVGGLFDRAAALGVVSFDARHAVPNEYWGWERNTPDRAHFTEPGHRALAKQLVAAGDASHLWDALTTP